ncbi:MAG: gamma-glutamyltransferase [Bacillota bacterium]
MVEAKKLAFADRLGYAGDKRSVDFFPLEKMTGKLFAGRRRAAIGPRAAEEVRACEPGLFEGETTSFVVADREGNAVSFIQSLSLSFGSGVTVPGTGIVLNDRTGRGFSLVEGHPYRVGPRKKTIHTLNTYLVTREGRLFMVGNTPGGDGQPQWNLQVLAHVIDGGMTAQEAVEAPRWTSLPGTDPATIDTPVQLRVEERLPAETIAALEGRGHVVKTAGAWAGGGRAQVIVVAPKTGVRMAGTDPRVEGAALVD